MKSIFLLCVLVVVLPNCVPQSTSGKRTVCFYDSRSYYRPESGKFKPVDLEPALSQCTHLIYGYAKIDAEDFKLKHRDDDLEKDTGKRNYMATTLLKKKFPGLSVLLSVGGWADVDDSDKYLTMLREADKRSTFISSVTNLLQVNGFDGLDLAWQFPWQRVKHTSTAGSVFHKFKKTFGLSKGNKDEQADEHKAGFTALIKDLKTAFRPNGKQLTATVIPHTNYSEYFDPTAVSPHLDAVHLLAFDYITPEDKISPDTADYPAPLFSSYDRKPELNMDYTVNWFLNNNMPAAKLVLGIPAHGRTWKLTEDSSVSGHPPITADGPGAEGYLSDTRGILIYPEICSMIQTSSNKGTKGLLRQINDPTKKLGTFAYRNLEKDREGLWVGFENPDSVVTKALYAKNKQLGGVALVHVNDDDFKGVCGTDRYPLLKAIRGV